MSVSLHVWAVNEPNLSDVLVGDGWSPDGEGFQLLTRNYNIFVGSPSRVFPEDVPEEAAALIPGLAWFVTLLLEGVTPTGDRALNKSATAIARSSHGLIEDPQETTLRLPSGVRRLTKPPSSERIGVLSLGWWAPGGPLLTESGVLALVSTLAARLPEGLPGRWGLYEPPDHSLAEEGPSGFGRFLEENRESLVVTRGRWPFIHDDYRLNKQWGWHSRLPRFEVTYVLVELDASLLDQPGWGRQLSAVFAELSELIQPFYGEARVREGVDKHRGHIDPSSPILPIRYNWWCGLPHAAPLAAVLGDPYLDLWPGFGSERRDGLALDSEPNWSRTHTIAWEVPADLMQPVDAQWVGAGAAFVLGDPSGVAQRWPFESAPR